ncbi:MULTISPECIES: carboxymuconolactone decarboxylase family protein [unclassified Streptomyces]|uniref:carboxymuconolactone decarboxylase family protein n=1 Tax=unclassified Streptomyces TaxID=2593676 RepID=UPI002E2EB0D2|nr:carboxymuconolactone decarboxylase family protein [Streptomyces sp. NBC_01477]
MSTETTDTPGAASATAQPVVVPAVRLAVDTLVPHANRAMNALDAAARDVGLEAPLLELVRARASQLNGCAYCVDTHARDAREGGESERRLYALPVWRETPFFTARERAALELTEAATRLTDGQVGDDVFARAAAQFSEKELAELIWAITVINAWNRLGATARPWPLS